MTDLFRESLYEIMTSDEIDRVIKYAPWYEKRWLKRFKKNYLEMGETMKKVSIWILLANIKSRRLYADVITFMVDKDE